jgi:GH24 family phage-related lysozyme (muramidase)
MRTSERGIALIKKFEGFYPSRYICPAGLPTIGFGHVIRTGEKFPAKMTEKEATDLLAKDVAIFEQGVARAVTVPLQQNEFDALVSFSFNVGLQALRTSTLLKMLNANTDRSSVAMQFLRWNKANGQVLAGLSRRRAAESAMFMEK